MTLQPDRLSPDAVPDYPAIWDAWWRSFWPRAPLSGDVSQAMSGSMQDSIGGQLGFINIHASRSGDVQIEQRITEQVASYGRQLGWIVDALDVLIRTGRPAGLAADDADALDQLTALRAEVESVKENVARDRNEPLVADIRALRRDPERNRDDLQRLRRALDGD